MQLSKTIKLYLNQTQYSLVINTMNTYINTVNSLISDATKGISITNYTSKNVTVSLPSALKKTM